MHSEVSIEHVTFFDEVETDRWIWSAESQKIVKRILPPIILSVFSPLRICRRATRRFLDAQPEPLKEAILALWSEIQIVRITHKSRTEFRKLNGMKGLKVHLGCGRDIKPGWVNVDLRPKALLQKDLNEYADTIFVQHDLRMGLPLDENSCDFIYSSHYFEHMSYQDGLRLMYDCYRTLEPGGRFRIVLPNMKELFSRYLEGDAKYFELIDIYRYYPEMEPETRTLIDYLNHAAYQLGQHKIMYDEEKVTQVLRSIGFNSVAVTAFMDDVDSDRPLRRQYSFYVEAAK